MLVLSRKVGEAIKLGDNIEITVLGIENQRVRLGIRAPRDVSIRRVLELDVDETNREAAVTKDQVLSEQSVLENAARVQKKEDNG